jgi:hypothetical protein
MSGSSLSKCFWGEVGGVDVYEFMGLSDDDEEETMTTRRRKR